VVLVNNEHIKILHKNKTYIALNKPPNVISNIKKQDKRKTIIDLVDHNGYLFIVGRLDYQSEGLILLLDDGELANRLTHPRYEHEKEYDIFVVGKPSHNKLESWREGVILKNGYKTLPCKVGIIKIINDGTWLKITLKEGKKRQLREVGRIVGLPVKRIVRRRISTLLLGDLAPGQWRYLHKDEVQKLIKAAHLHEQR